MDIQGLPMEEADLATLDFLQIADSEDDLNLTIEDQEGVNWKGQILTCLLKKRTPLPKAIIYPVSALKI